MENTWLYNSVFLSLAYKGCQIDRSIELRENMLLHGRDHAFWKTKKALVKIPIIVQYVESETRVSGAHKIKPSKLKKGKVIHREPSMFLFKFLESSCCILSLISFHHSAIFIPCLSRYVLSLWFLSVSLCWEKRENLWFAAVTGLIVLKLTKQLLRGSLFKWRKERLHVWMLFFSTSTQLYNWHWC